MSNEKIKALVVGSKGHKLAKKCIDWGVDFYIGDYDLLVLDLETLTQRNLDIILDKNPQYFQKIRDHLVDVQARKGVNVICLMSNLKLASKITEYSSGEEKQSNCNYSWSPIIPIMENVPGEGLDKESAVMPNGLLELLDKWEAYYENFVNNSGYDQLDEDTYFRVKKRPLLKNKADRDVAFALRWIIQKEYSYTQMNAVKLAARSEVFFFPKTKNNKEAIDILLKEHTTSSNETEEAPDWIEEIVLPGESELTVDLQAQGLIVDEAKKKIEEKKEALTGLRYYKKLLYCQGRDELEPVVQDSFELLGIELLELVSGELEDRHFKDEDAVIPVEIRGKNKSGMNEADLGQIIKRLADKPESAVYKTRGLFILNHYRFTKPTERPKAFEPGIVTKAKQWNVCLLSTTILFELVRKKLAGEKLPDLQKTLFNSVGEFEIREKKSTQTKKQS